MPTDQRAQHEPQGGRPRVLTTPMREIPAWAVLERHLMAETETAWRRFVELYCEPDGRLRYTGGFEDRDGVDDFYEPFFNWPLFYTLGGSDEILDAAKHHWRGVTAQLTEAGMLTDEFENGYDWFHQGESLIFLYALCAADPADDDFADRARRFAELYTDPRHRNYDPVANIIAAPHTGSLGPLVGIDPVERPYSASRREMSAYGLPHEHLPGIESWNDLNDPANAAAMGRALQELAQGDVTINLAATSLVANRWLYDGDESSREWIARYVGGWIERAAANGGLIPDNVAPDGTVGGLQGGRWFGGHYGWTWPHGLPSVGMGALIGAINLAFVTGDESALDLARTVLDTVLEHSITASVDETPMSTRTNWLGRLGDDAATAALLVPHRFGRSGWFDYAPMPLDLPTWLWWWSREPADWARLRRVMDGYPEASDSVKPFRDKAEAGHELPWLAFLAGENADYPVRALSMALGQLARRATLMETEHPDPATVHIHFWQRVNPVGTEILGQLMTGTPQVLYNGGLPFAALAYDDPDRGRPGLPPDVAALVTRLEGEEIDLTLVNLSLTRTRRVVVRPSRFEQQRIVSVVSLGEVDGVYPGSSVAYTSLPGRPVRVTVPVDAPHLVVELPPSHRADLVLTTATSAGPPRHHRAAPRADA
ncbi:hypothetical protein ACEXQD_00510 [Herbiconiux sp. P15]|uniref:hypothetical protein n=1 Tax=Herbiconiux liukaitaii TaxID=3342799 RepID=UPI0035B7517D